MPGRQSLLRVLVMMVVCLLLRRAPPQLSLLLRPTPSMVITTRRSHPRHPRSGMTYYLEPGSLDRLP
jgi:hypothetical protein